MVFAHAQVWQVNWIYPVSWHYAFDIILRQYFDHSVPFAILSAVLIVAAVVARLAGVRSPAGDMRRLLVVCAAWLVIPTALVVVYSADRRTDLLPALPDLHRARDGRRTGRLHRHNRPQTVARSPA